MDISKIKLPDNNIYNIKDEIAREKVLQKIEDFVLYAFFDDQNNDEIKFFVSRDNVHLSQIKTTNKIYGRDPSICFYNNKFYVAITNHTETHDFVIYESEDLENWTTHEINVGLYDATYQRRWAPDFFIDDNNDLYVFISKQYTNTEGWGDFEIYKTKCTDIENLTFENATKINLIGTTSTNHIDATCMKIDNIYHLLVKNENQNALNIEHYTSADLLNFSLLESNFADFGSYVEGMFMYKFKNKFIVGAENYANDTYYSEYTIKESSDFLSFSNGEKMYLDKIDLSHGSACIIDNDMAKDIITNLEDFNINYNHNFNKYKYKNYIISSNTISSNLPRARYLKLFSIFPKVPYKNASILFNIADIQKSYFNSLISCNIQFTTVTPLITTKLFTKQISANHYAYEDYKYSNLYGKIICVTNTNEKCIDLYFDLNDYTDDMTIAIDFISYNLFDEEIKVYKDIYTNTLPVEISSNIDSGNKTKNIDNTQNTAYIDNQTSSTKTLKFASANGSIKVYGHYNSNTKENTVDYTLNILNGAINAINNNSDLSSELTFNLLSYTNHIYELEISNIPNYSVIYFELGNNINNAILDLY